MQEGGGGGYLGTSRSRVGVIIARKGFRENKKLTYQNEKLSLFYFVREILYSFREILFIIFPLWPT